MTVSVIPGARALVLLSLVAMTAGCGLPRSGPTTQEILASASEKNGDAFVVEVDDRVARAASYVETLGFTNGFLHAGEIGSDVISPGDTLTLKIWENVDDGLLAGRASNVTMLDSVQVDGAGFIFVPYAGRILAAGNTPEALRRVITEKLAPQTPDPQVTVTRAAGDGATVSVVGGVGGQGVYPIERPTRTLSAMIAKAGGVSIPPEIAQITVTRNGYSGKIWLTDLYTNPETDIALRPGDVILVEEDSRAFTALGATGGQTRVQFTTQELSAIEAVARVGGLSSAIANPKGVFIFRDEPPEVANAVLNRNDLTTSQRLIYLIDLTKPSGVFVARDFTIRDGDTLYVTEAPYVRWQKILSAIIGTANSADTVNTLAGN
ncbi:polysaccharide biosynthesis/export family protein [Ostreiculturibacter nitratireducens]|uniref:polysaccharide biosynthesis/export family protein n=1 Tax=Ostreiculturibacter nitratireducens TaxID=3075226 RepID=UPI003CCC59B2